MAPSQESARFRHFFTITTGVDDSNLLTDDEMLSFFKSIAKRYTIAKERGVAAGKCHWHIIFSLPDGGKRRGSTLIKLFAAVTGVDASNIHAMPVHDFNAAMKYTGKADHTLEYGPYTSDPTYLGLDLRVLDMPYPWQGELIEAIKQSPDDRTIIWIRGHGNDGKSKLLKKIVHTGDGDTQVLGVGDAAQLASAVCSEKPYRVYLLDIPRVGMEKKHQLGLFATIEAVKNGMVASHMYGKHKRLMFEPPHVIVFSNDLPDTSLLTQDRWRIGTINDAKEVVWE